PLIERFQDNSRDELQQTIDLLFGVEGLRTEMLRNTMLRRGDDQLAARLPLPRDVLWTPPPIPVAPPDVDIEPMAMHVPEECFYVRFGSFGNFTWLTGLMKDISGQAGQAVNLRGHESGGMSQLETRLVLKQTKIGKLFGGTTVDDVAMIGRDIYLNDGPAIGLLFKAKNKLFENDTRKKRKAALAKEKKNGATLETLKLAGKDVSFLSTPDNRLRSFYAIDGDYHLITTSRTIAERFLEAGAGRGALGKSREFRHARTLMPTNRNDTVFVYFSSAFFRGLLGPHYQIELRRRLRSVSEMELSKLAKLAARNEGIAGAKVDDLIAAGHVTVNGKRVPP
ncbi:MAG: hypothetical protein IH991_24265, partial [Planctomycetes bacterium]|nr:hypothetical protein [Planctomycetota bacterium]